MAKNKTTWVCTDCGDTSPTWAGKCPHCGSWNTLKEITVSDKKGKGASALPGRSVMAKPRLISELDTEEELRFCSGISELDRVLGGGIVEGSLILVGGAPGIGKSTLLLQMCGTVSEKRVLYITGEESERQLKLRAVRLGVAAGPVYVVSETDMDAIASCIEDLSPEIIILDSIQTVSDSGLDSAPGSVAQVRECTMRIMRLCKDKSITGFIVGHITKEGNIAGPKILEHMVDCVLYFEGDRSTSFRILRAVKNRFGSTNEIGVFEMLSDGLRCVENPSEMLLAGRPKNSSGTCVACVVEGTRPILAEVQALVTPTSYNAARRSNGIDNNRIAMLLAVLEKRVGLPVTNCDAYLNVIGGILLDEPAADLAAVLAIASSYLDKPLGSELAAIGEIGLSGEVRAVSGLGQRLNEIERLGFTKCVVPARVTEKLQGFTSLQLIQVNDIAEAVRVTLGNKKCQS